MQLSEIYTPIRKELQEVEKVIRASLRGSRNEAILKVNRFLADSAGKRLRPALVILSARTASRKAAGTARAASPVNEQELINIASGVELIHMASLVHDDVIDHSTLRHLRPTINSRWGQDVAIALGDYLYSLGFQLISNCKNLDVLDCISSATRRMCEGEFIQVCERDNISLLKERYIVIIKKKTAALFAASCQTGAIVSHSERNVENALGAYGLNFGIAFQIVDDCLDLLGQKEKLGKAPGQDMVVGEMTLPVLNLLEHAGESERQELIGLLGSKTEDCLGTIRTRLFGSRALPRTRRVALCYMKAAKKKLEILPESNYRRSLSALADFVLAESLA